jgi:glycosyltransferase involved in cell wall biosynthesis
MGQEPLISIITVVYNGAAFLEQTIESVINQTYKNIEYIVIDGGSTDGTLDIIDKYQEHVAHFVSEPDKGLYDAMNKGIAAASGDLIGTINSDDWYELNALELVVAAFRRDPNAALFHADRFDVYEDGKRAVRKFNPSRMKFVFYGMTYSHPSMFVSKSEYQLHSYNVELRSLSDYQFVLETFLRDETSLHYIEETIVNYRLGGISAQLSLMDSVKEGLIARREAGLNIFYNYLAALTKILIKIVKR